MPTNLKSLLTRSRSKNELKLRESKDEISPSGDSESNNGDNSDDKVCSNNTKCCCCECSGHQVKDDDCGCCRCRNNGGGSESSLCSSGTKLAGSYLYNENDTENNCFPNNDLSYNSDSYGRNDESPSSSEHSCYSDESFLKSLNRTSAPSNSTTLSTMMPPGNSFHHHHHHHHHGPYQCCSQQCYTSSSYDMVPTVGVGGGGGAAAGGTDYSGYFLEEKSNNVVAPSRMVSMLNESDNGGGGGREMRRNASCRTLFLSGNTLHPPNCNSFESGHMEPPLGVPSSIEFPIPHASSSLSSTGNVAAVPSSIHHHQHHVGPSFLRNPTDGCGSLACESPSAAPCCTFNVKDGSPCQSLSMRKCETVLALSSLNNGTVGTTTTPVTTTSGNKSSSSSYMRNAPGIATYSNFSSGAAAAASLTSSGTTMSHLSSSGGVQANASTHVGGKVRVMKEKIFSTSSSALNCLLHSSSRTGKLFSGWKLSSGGSGGGGNSSNSGSNMNVGHMFNGSSEGSNCLGVNCQPNKHFLGASSTTSDNNKLGSTTSTRSSHHHHHKSRSQLSISENSFSSSPAPLTPVNRLRRNVSVNNTSSFCPTSGSLSAHSSYSRSSSVASFVGWKEKEDPFDQSLFCRLCLSYVRLEETMEILACSCRYCKDCLISYVSFEIQEGADEIACPDASCEKQGVLGLQEVEQLVSPMLMEKHKKFKLFREVEKDSKLMWCPSPGCETVCQIQNGNGILTGGFVPEIDRAHGGVAVVGGSGSSRSLPFISCPTCQKTYCAGCKLSWHPDSSCESFRRKLIKQGKLSTEDDELFSLESIKKCPFCHVPIEKDSGCAQMMCKRCKHVFCWYCLASLDDDFLLRHYDKGPCKNKLGHSRASVVWHRAQVIGIFAGFGVLVLLASPLLILAAPCLLCCRCRYCANKLDPEESDLV